MVEISSPHILNPNKGMLFPFLLFFPNFFGAKIHISAVRINVHFDVINVLALFYLLVG